MTADLDALDCGQPLFRQEIRGDLPPAERSRVRHGRVDWRQLSPLEALTMLAAMIAVSADTTSPKGDRHTTYVGIYNTFRLRFDTARRWSGEDVGDAVMTLTDRGALAFRPGRVDVLAWPIPGGAPW